MEEIEMQEIDINQTVFSLSLLGALVFGVVFARVVRWASSKKWVGQTAWSVVVGVTFTLIAMIPRFGIDQVAIMFCYFAASGTPMIIEYLTRVQQEMRHDNEEAKKVASEFLNDRQAGSR
jgi:pyrroloquinoline quinone (PQQ) biosynthesis protein C